MKSLMVAVAALALLPNAANAEDRPLTSFTKVSASAGTHVELQVGPAFHVSVEGRDADRIVTRVSNGTLIVEPVRTIGFSWRGRRDALVRVSMPALDGLDASSGAHIEAQGVTAGALMLDASSGAMLEAAGVCENFTADASSGAHIDAAGLQCQTGSVDVSSGAQAHVFATGRLNVDASSGGDVIASGDPEIGDISLSSGGSLRRR